MNTKICNNCQEDKSLDNFYYRKNRNCYDGICRSCNAKLAKERRNNNQAIKEKMKQNIAGILGIDTNDVNIKATTNEGVGSLGTEAIAAFAVATLKRRNSK